MLNLVAKYSLEEYEITYVLDDGELQEGLSNPTTYTINSNITLNNPTKAGYDFTGWTINDGDVLYPTINIQNQTGNVTYTAHYELKQPAPIICRKAITLTQATCQLDNISSGCSEAGYANGETFTYGNIVNSDTYSVGDAFECDVDGTGNYQRFYYLRTLDEKAVLISNNNFEGDDGQQNNNNYTYDVALTKLPRSSDQWTNFPVTFDGYAARLVTVEDLQVASGNTDLDATDSLKNLTFLYENIGKFTTTSGRSTVWLYSDEDTYSSGHAYRYHVNGLHTNIASIGGSKPSSNCVRPVVEVPLDQIDDSYVVHFDPNGGAVTGEYRIVTRGNKLGTLPVPTNGDYVFDNWYTTDQFSETINENTIPSGYETYYAHWIASVTSAILENDTFNLQNGESDSIIVTNSADIEPYTFESSNQSVAIVTQNGVITATGVGSTTIVMRGTNSNQTINITVNVTEDTNYYAVTLDYQYDKDNEELHINKGDNISGLPTPTRDDYTFTGWYDDTNWENQVENGDAIDSNITLFARWMSNDTVAEMNKVYYSNVQTAINEAPDNVKTTIRIVKDLTFDSSNAETTQTLFNINGSQYANKDLVLDLDGHQIEFNPNSKQNVIKTGSSLEVKNGTIISDSQGAAIDVHENGKLVINSGRIENKQRQAVYNEGGEVLIGGTAELVSKASGVYENVNRATLQNYSGTTTITGGTIINTTGSAISVGTGTLTIGTKDGVSVTSLPIIIGKTYGIDSASNEFSFYDGIIKGVTNFIKDPTKLPDSNIEEGYEKNESTEVIDTLTYKVLTLIKTSVPEPVTVTLQVNGGELPTGTSSTIDLTEGDEITTLPEPTKGVYEFAGWYIDEELQTPVTLPTTPQDGDTYYAKWVYPNNGELTTFRTTNDAMVTYYSSIDTWKLDSSNFPEWGAGENTAMRVNFDANNCMCADNQCSTSGTVHCDKPKGYDTRLGEKVNVYLYDEVNNQKGDLVLYSNSDNGVIYNLIPNKVYYWELNSDHSVYGYIKFISERRNIDAGDVLNIRDLGGLPVDIDNNGSTDGYVKYERLFRGSKLNSLNSPAQLTNLGITNELDLRKQSEASDDYNNGYKLNNYLRMETQNYYVIPNSTDQTENDNYTITRAAVKYVMEQIAYHENTNIYFHCRIGTDRTGTLAYILEGLLGVPDEDKVQDFELSFFYGLVNVHRYHNNKPTSSGALKTHRFVYFHDELSTNQKVYEWYMAGTTEDTRAYDEQLVQDFRDAMIVYN